MGCFGDGVWWMCRLCAWEDRGHEQRFHGSSTKYYLCNLPHASFRVSSIGTSHHRRHPLLPSAGARARAHQQSPLNPILLPSVGRQLPKTKFSESWDRRPWELTLEVNLGSQMRSELMITTKQQWPHRSRINNMSKWTVHYYWGWLRRYKTYIIILQAHLCCCKYHTSHMTYHIASTQAIITCVPNSICVKNTNNRYGTVFCPVHFSENESLKNPSNIISLTVSMLFLLLS